MKMTPTLAIAIMISMLCACSDPISRMNDEEQKSREDTRKLREQNDREENENKTLKSNINKAVATRNFIWVERGIATSLSSAIDSCAKLSPTDIKEKKKFHLPTAYEFKEYEEYLKAHYAGDPRIEKINYWISDEPAENKEAVFYACTREI